MLRETTLFDALHSELAIVLEETRDDEIDANRVATRMLENDGPDGCSSAKNDGSGR